jgi:predicted acylesterase/phospholipase RssA
MSPQTVNQPARGRRRTRRALVLGGGGLLGAMFQIGVLAALEEADPDRTEFDLVVGTSGGAVVAALLAAGMRPTELRRMAPSCGSPRRSVTCSLPMP